MWLAARESKTDEQLRTRVLEYLSEGDILPSLQELVDDEVFEYSDWQPLLERIDNPESAREWRASTARELASYRDHPGLLVGRAFAEAIDPDGNLREFEFNLESSLTSARRNYSTTNEKLAEFLRWARTTLRPMNLDASICAASLASDLGVGEPFKSEELIALAREGSIHAGILLMAGTMKRAHEMAITTDDLLHN